MLDLLESRQSFLGPSLDTVLQHARIGIIGLSGGGSHVAQQLAHIGFRQLYVLDPDCLEGTNLERVVGATAGDVPKATPKVEIARRVILSVRPDATVQIFQDKWQKQVQHLRCVDLIFGCVDSILCRRDLDSFAHRYRIPLIDVGMDVHPQVRGFRMAGQTVLSMPGKACLTCQRVITTEGLNREGGAYGAAGPRPQVVWTNAILASTAIGIAMDLLTGWAGTEGVLPFVTFDGNAGTLSSDARHRYAPSHCEHFQADHLGDPAAVQL